MVCAVELQVNIETCMLMPLVNHKMFSKFIILLLKFFDFCGFHTETPFFGSKNQTVYISLVHCVCAIALTYFVFAHSTEPIILGEVLPYLVNEILQIMNGMLTHWTIIIESYVQRDTQKQFWKIFRYIEQHHVKCKKSFLHTYKIKFIEFFSVVTIIQIIFTCYFTHYVGNYYFFRFAYLVSQIVYQYRVFYYLFYLDLIAFELNIIKKELKMVASRTHGHYYPMESINSNLLKEVNADCQRVFELIKCLNQIFGWSNFTTVLYCFHLPLTDSNWAVWELHQRTTVYITGING